VHRSIKYAVIPDCGPEWKEIASQSGMSKTAENRAVSSEHIADLVAVLNDMNATFASSNGSMDNSISGMQQLRSKKECVITVQVHTLYRTNIIGVTT
jgi:hypothetical protein